MTADRIARLKAELWDLNKALKAKKAERSRLNWEISSAQTNPQNRGMELDELVELTFGGSTQES